MEAWTNAVPRASQTGRPVRILAAQNRRQVLRGPWRIANSPLPLSIRACPTPTLRSSGFHPWSCDPSFNPPEPPYADPHVRWCGRGGRGDLPPLCRFSGGQANVSKMMGSFEKSEDVSSVTRSTTKGAIVVRAQWPAPPLVGRPLQPGFRSEISRAESRRENSGKERRALRRSGPNSSCTVFSDSRMPIRSEKKNERVLPAPGSIVVSIVFEYRGIRAPAARPSRWIART